MFAVRIATMALSTVLMAVLLAAPFINILAYRGGLRWLAAYGVVVAVGATAAALSVALTVALFRTIGPKRTRLAAQIVAAIIGATFVIGLQVAAILSYGTLSYLVVPEIRPAGGVRAGPARASCGGRRAPCSATCTALAAVLALRRRAAGRRDRDLLGALWRARHRRRRRLRQRRVRTAARRASAASRPGARCARRNGRCCAAIPGSPRRR